MDEDRKKPRRRPTKTFKKVPTFSTLSGSTREECGMSMVTTATPQETNIAQPVALHSDLLSQAQPVTIPKTDHVVSLVMSYCVQSHSSTMDSFDLGESKGWLSP